MKNCLLPVLLSILVVVLVLALFVLGRRAKARLVARYPPPGKLVDVGGHRLHIVAPVAQKGGSHPTGEDSPPNLPTVVMESGRGDSCLTWSAVQAEVAKFARVVIYDRAGLGWSDQDSKPRTASNAVDELNRMLELAGESPPFILVGHSLGGLYIRLYAHKYRTDVAGLVLIDPSHEGLEMGPVAWINDRVLTLILRCFQLMNTIGLLALMTDTWGLRWPVPAPPEIRSEYAGLAYRDNKHMNGCIQEIKNTLNILAEVRSFDMGALGDVPLTVISSAPIPVPRGCCSCLAGYVQRGNARGAELHTQLALLSTKGQRVVAQDGGHYIHHDSPDLVIDAIRKVAEEAEAQLTV